VDLVARVRLFEYRVLIVEHERCRAPGVGAREFGILDDDARVSVELAIHVAAHHLAELGPVGECNARRMTDNEPFAVVVHEGQEIFLLLIRQHSVAAGQHEDCVIVVERACVDATPFITSRADDLPFSDELRVRCNDRNVCARLSTDLLHRRERMRDRVVMETALRISDG
jgi:hypothetical protein